MIRRETTEEIWICYREIEAAKKLLSDMEEKAKQDTYDPNLLKDSFGHSQKLQLGIPSGENCHRLFDVSPKLATSVINAQLAAKRAELVEMNERARLELDET